MAGAELVVKILTDASQASAGIDSASGKFGQFKSGMQSLAGPAAAVAGGVALIGVSALNAASDAQQAMGGIDAVFGDSADQIKSWAAEASTAVGLSQAAYGEFATVVGAQLKNLGVPMEQVGGNTNDLIKLGADLAATYGGTTSEAVSALSSALRGEADPAERYGLALNTTAVNAELAAQGLTGLEGEALTAAKAQAIMGLASEQAAGAVGQFGRESDTVAGQTQIMNASMEDASAALGEALLPVIAPLIGMLGEFAGWIEQNSAVMGPLIAAVGILAAGILALNIVMAANPIGLIIIAVIALIAGIILLWNTNEAFRNFFINIWESIAGFFVAVWEGAVSVVGSVVNWFRSAWDNVAQFFRTIWAVAVAVVQAYFSAYAAVVMGIINGIKAVVGAVANFFRSAWESAVSAVTSIIRTLQGVFTSVFNAIMGPINAVVGAFNNVIGAIKNVISWLGRIKIPDIGGAIGGLFGGGKSAPAPAVFSASALSGAAVSPTASFGGGGGGTVINISGGLDSADTIARRVRQLLTDRDRRTGGVHITRSPR